MLKHSFYCLVVIFTLVSCNKDDGNPYSYDQQTIYSDTETNPFREFVMLLKPYILDNGVRKYIVEDSLFNVKVNINGQDWGEFASLKVDTSAYTIENLNGFRVTAREVKYPVIAPYALPEDTLHTAGQFAALINNFYVLKPGDYIAEVPFFRVKRSDGVTVAVKANIVEWVRIEENSRSAFIGEFEVEL